jgi:hypothetical protein
MCDNGSSLVSNSSNTVSSFNGSNTVSSFNGSNTSVKNAEKKVSLHVITSKDFINRFPYDSSTPINESIPIWEEIKTEEIKQKK